ncbi:MAG TPA: ABC transporter substrate-binding protein [Ramlibacter sp.]|uniref:ABC transporter substrate-binding protein n=1 Tax=Ramlibacter sp. TaxID=1917967 RepID=UPI002CB17C0E|nr:ABC transporter substrate-binding protein [Ramlibacter sp.]HVZ46039.1 ABC transporter substrate-binding protein [Ramlibacter sp.]
MNIRTWARATSLGLALGLAAACYPTSAQQPPPPEKVFRYAFPVAETGFDPPQLSDLYSRIVTANIFEALYGYDYLARPVKIVPVIADGMPLVAPDFRTYTVKLKRGIFFADDAAFAGKKHEVTANDVAYTYKRFYDPATKSQQLASMLEEGIVGMEELNKRAIEVGKFEYDTPVEGIQVLDRYTIQFKLKQPRPRFIYTLADPGVAGIVAREVVEKYGASIMEHPVGTGAFMLSQWRRASKITLVKNPNYHEDYYTADPAPGDAKAQAIYARLKGKRLPLVDKVEVSIIEEPQPRWLAFLNNEHELVERLPYAYAPEVVPRNQLAPKLAKRGIQLERVPLSDVTFMYWNMTDPVTGGYTPEKVALRRAMALAYDAKAEVRLPRRGQAIVAQGPIMPRTASYDPNFRTEMGTYDPARAIALLDMYGYTDRDGDGWREQPNGQPLVIEYYTLSSADYRELDEIFKKCMDAIGVKVVLKIGKWPDHLKNARAGKLQMWALGLSASTPDSGPSFAYGYGKSLGEDNLAWFKNAKFDELYEKQSLMPNGPERDALLREMVRILVAYMPYKYRTHRIGIDLTQPWVVGYMRHPFARDFWRFVDIDTSKLPRK